MNRRAAAFSFASLMTLVSCTSMYNNDVGYVTAAAQAVVTTKEDLNALRPDRSEAQDCELEQRTYIFISNIPVFSSYINFNKLWIEKLYEYNPKLREKNDSPLSPCVKDPYIRQPANNTQK